MRYLALFIATVVAFSMLPTNLLGSFAMESYPPEKWTKHDFKPSSYDSSACDICGYGKSAVCHSGSSSSSSSSSVTSGESSEESKPGISKEEQKRLDEEALQQKLREMYKKNSKVVKGGKEVNTTIPGAYAASGVKGVAVTTPKEELQKKFGVKNAQNLRVQTWDVNEKKSPEAYKSLQNAAAQAGGEVGAAVQINIYEEKDGKQVKMNPLQGSVEVTMGLPENMVGKDVTITQVIEGGTVAYQKDKDNDPNTVTFDASAGESAYGVVKGGNPYKPSNPDMLTEMFAGFFGPGLYAKLNSMSPEDRALYENISKADNEATRLNIDDYPTSDAYESAVDAIYQKYGLESYDSAMEKAADLIYGDED